MCTVQVCVHTLRFLFLRILLYLDLISVDSLGTSWILLGFLAIYSFFKSQFIGKYTENGRARMHPCLFPGEDGLLLSIFNFFMQLASVVLVLLLKTEDNKLCYN